MWGFEVSRPLVMWTIFVGSLGLVSWGLKCLPPFVDVGLFGWRLKHLPPFVGIGLLDWGLKCLPSFIRIGFLSWGLKYLVIRTWDCDVAATECPLCSRALVP